MFEKLKQRWEISTGWQLLPIIVVFAITGSTSMFLTNPILNFLEISLAKMSPFLFYSYKIGIIFILYQFLLLWFGFLFGQYNFFWKFITNMLSKMTFGIFKSKKNPE
jgi:manganese efflux pump family protein